MSPELDAVAVHALEIQRDRRISSAREFQARLLEILSRHRPKLLPQDVRDAVDVLSGRRPADAQFFEFSAAAQDRAGVRIEMPRIKPADAPLPPRPTVVTGQAVSPPAPARGPRDGALVSRDREVPTAPLVFSGAFERAEDDLVVHNVPLASMMDFMPNGAAPVIEAAREVEKHYADSNRFFVRYHDGTVLTASGLDECLRSCDPQLRQAAALSVDDVNWLDLPTFARLCGLDYLAPDSAPLRNVTMVGMLEERSLVSVFVALGRSRLTGKLVIMDKGVQRVARREIDVVGGAPVHVYTDHPSLQLPHLYVQHDLLKKEMIPDLVVQVLRHRHTLEEVARRQAFNDLNPYRPLLMRDRLGEIFSWRVGKFAFDAGRELKAVTPFAPSLLRILPDAVQRGYSPQELRRDLEPYMNVKLRRTDSFDAMLQELGLKDRQALAARRLGLRTSLGQVLKKNPGESLIQLAMGFILLELGVLVAA